MPKLDYGEPDYKNLKCPKCGNTEHFVEFALRETKQEFSVDPGEGAYDWLAFESLDEVYPEEIVCAKCYPKELVPVWKAASGENGLLRESRMWLHLLRQRRRS